MVIPSLVSAQSLRGDRNIRNYEWGSMYVGSETRAEYFLGIGDVIDITVWKNLDLTRSLKIGPDGYIFFPLAGKVKAADLSIEQLQESLKEKLSAFIRYPDVNIQIQSIAGKKIVVLGEVVYPGIYVYQGKISVIEAIGLAGDFTLDAKREALVVVSGNLTKNPKMRRVNMFRTLWKGNSSPELMLQEGDVVYVPRTFEADFTRVMGEINVWMQAPYNASYTLINARALSKPLFKK